MGCKDASKLRAIRHACVRMQIDNPARVLYVDPFKLSESPHDADIVCVTHPHHDHLSVEDIVRVSCNNTIVVSTIDCKEELLEAGFLEKNLVFVKPNQHIDVAGVAIQTTPMYNVGKTFHEKACGWVGYIIDVDGTSVYVMGDTDINEDVLKVKSDVLFVPIGGTYTMDMEQAACYVNAVKPKLVIPVHYAFLNDTRANANGFREAIDEAIDVRVDLAEGEQESDDMTSSRQTRMGS